MTILEIMYDKLLGCLYQLLWLVLLYIVEIVNEIWKLKEEYKNEEDSSMKKNILTALKNSLIKNQEIGDVKLKIVAKIFEIIESRTRQLDLEFENLGNLNVLMMNVISMFDCGILFVGKMTCGFIIALVKAEIF